MVRLNSCQSQPLGMARRIDTGSGHGQCNFFKVGVRFLLQAQNNLDCLLVLDDLGVALGEVTSVFVQRPVAAEHVDECQSDLVEGIVEDQDNPVDALFLEA